MQNTNESASEPSAAAGSGISRRDLLLGLGAVAGVAGSGPLLAAMPGHDHSKHAAQQPDLLAAVMNCVDKGQRCIAHCLVSYQEGDLELADCAAKVHEMQAICSAYGYLLAANSSYARDYAAICRRVCEDCEKACLEHEEHIECKACANACAEVVDQIALVYG
jgi:Cys-rich four helix bundle protein (predicted Tat secretion target)